MMDSSVGG